MRPIGISLVASALIRSSQSVFSVHDDLLAFPQYEVIFSDNYILDTDAHSRLSNPHPDQSSPKDTATDDDAPSSDLTSHTPSDFLPSDSPSTPSPSSYHRMTLHSRPYLCSIPHVSTPLNNTNTTIDPAAEAAELARATDRGWELLKDMEGHCMYFVSGWWSYSFCYNTAVKQFHSLPPGKGGAPMFPPTEDPNTPSYVLGKYDASSSPSHQRHGWKQKGQQQQLGTGSDNTPQTQPQSQDTTKPPSKNPSTSSLRTAGSTRYLTQHLTSGTTCDLTSRPRKIEVQYHCHAHGTDRIGWIKEVATCTYLMGIYTPRLCNDIAFLPPRETKAAGILCREIVSSDGDGDAVREYERRRREERGASAEKFGVGNGDGNARPTVAGIEIGGMKDVGRPDFRLEAPAQIAPQTGSAGGKADILARQDSKEKGGKIYVLPKTEIKQLGIDPKLVDEAVRELRDVAGGKAWRLEVFDGVMGGREIRGIVEPEKRGVRGSGEGEGEEGFGEVEFIVVGGGEEGEGYEGEGEDGDEGAGSGYGEEEGSQEVYKDEL